MSTPVSATSTRATVSLAPGIVVSRSAASRKGHSPDVDLRLHSLDRPWKKMPVPERDPPSRKTVGQANEVNLVRERAGGEMETTCLGHGHASRVYFSTGRILFRFRHPPPMSAASDAL